MIFWLVACVGKTQEINVDVDRDGFTVTVDCDDNNPLINPGMNEVCDQIDNNCNGEVDETFQLLPMFLDEDGDGYGSEPLEPSCMATFGMSIWDGDCNDENSTVHPNATEHCDEIDNDCDGQIDNDPYFAPRYYLDADGDGYGVAGQSIVSCEAPDDYVDNYLDCDDTSSLIFPDATEVCDGMDNDCDGLIDQLDDDLDTSNASTFYLDADEDGHGDPMTAIKACTVPIGYVESFDDCNDANPEQRPSYSSDWCDGIDNDCDSIIDEDVKPSWSLVTTHEGFDGLVEIDPVNASFGNIHSLSNVGNIYSLDVSESGLAMVHTTIEGGRLMILDACNNQQTPLPLHNINGLGCGIAFGPHGKLYAINNQNDSLYEMDSVTGQGTLIGPIGIDIENCGLAYDCSSNALIATTSSTDELFNIDHTTGSAYNISQMSIDLTISVGMEYDASTNSVFLATALDLYNVQLATGLSTYVGLMDGNGFSNVNDLAFHPPCP